MSVLSLPLLLAVAGEAAAPPSTRRSPVEDRYHGITVTDDYRWLEDATSPEVVAWTDAQNRHTRAVLDALPGAEALRRRVREIRTIEVPRFGELKTAGGRLFALRFRPPQQQPVLVVLQSADRPDDARVLVDLNQIDASGGTSIDWYVPSLDGRNVAVSLSQGGSERGDVHVYDVRLGPGRSPTSIARVNYGTAGGSLAWDAAAARASTTRATRAGRAARGRPRLLPAGLLPPARHARVRRTATRSARTSRASRRSSCARAPDGSYVLANVQNGDGGEFEQHLRREDGSWTRLSRFEDRVLEAVFDPAGESLLLLSRAGASRGRLLRLDLRPSGPLDPPRPFLPEGEAVLESSFSWDATSKIVPDAGSPLRRRAGGRARAACGSSIAPASRSGSCRCPTRALCTRSCPSPAGTRSWCGAPRTSSPRPGTASSPEPSGSAGRLAKTACRSTSRSACGTPRSSREWAVSKDGTQVPLTVIAPKGAPARRHEPDAADGLRRLRREPDAVLRPGAAALARPRGRLRRREPARRRRVRRGVARRRAPARRSRTCSTTSSPAPSSWSKAGYTSPRRLAIEGGSNGGLLMGAVLTQRPELFAAVVSHVGIYDMLRVELSPNGAFNVTEFGTVQGPGAVRGALRLLAVPPRQGRHRATRRCCSRPARTTRASTRCTRARWPRGCRRRPRGQSRCCCARARARATASARASTSGSASRPTCGPSCSPSWA